MDHKPYKNCKRCARKLFGLTNKYSCYAWLVEWEETFGDGPWELREHPVKVKKVEKRACINFCRKKIKPIVGRPPLYTAGKTSIVRGNP